MSENKLIVLLALMFCFVIVIPSAIEQYQKIEFVKAGLQECVIKIDNLIVTKWMKDCPKIEEPSNDGGDSAEDKV